MPRIAIVGAGIAGLNAALTLQDAGLSGTIYEASDRIGGRIHSDSTTWADGMVSEWCGEFIDSNHETIYRLIKRFGLRTVALGGGETEQARSILYLLNRYQSAEVLAEDFEALAPLLHQQFQDAGFPTTYAHFTPEGKRLDHLSVYEWIEQYVQGGHEGLLGHLLENACTGLYGLNTREQSALNLVYLFGSPDSVRSLIASGPMQSSCKIMGGNQQLPRVIADSLPSDSLRLSHQLVALERTPD
ncbi:MAG TPA: FAD-dependent oxidoreductase, partial [Ktedonobacteraceae bacterium]|nr:FAD-dependent oxidoreductase [Ktedonobacteraceae bacterium]